MQHVAHIDLGRSLVELRLKGIVEADALLCGVEQLRQACRDHGTTGAIWDMREADLSRLDFKLIQARPEDWPSNDLPPNARIGLVAGNAQDAVLLRLWREAGNNRDSRERRIFQQIGEARDWVAGWSE